MIGTYCLVYTPYLVYNCGNGGDFSVANLEANHRRHAAATVRLSFSHIGTCLQRDRQRVFNVTTIITEWFADGLPTGLSV